MRLCFNFSLITKRLLNCLMTFAIPLYIHRTRRFSKIQITDILYYQNYIILKWQITIRIKTICSKTCFFESIICNLIVWIFTFDNINILWIMLSSQHHSLSASKPIDHNKTSFNSVLKTWYIGRRVVKHNKDGSDYYVKLFIVYCGYRS